jgi:uncharacterized protein with beta-barrel porin domain
MPSYAETTNSGTNAFALSYGSQSTVASRTELGAWLDKAVPLAGGNMLTLRGRAAWANDQSSNRAAAAAFQSLPGANFTVLAAAPANNLALLTTAAELRLGNHVSVGARFDGEFAAQSRTYAGTGTIRYVW